MQGDFREEAVLHQLGGRGRPAGRRGGVGHGAQPVGHRVPIRPHRAPGGTGDRLSPSRAPEARGCAGGKVFHGSGYSQLVEAVPSASGWSSRSSPRPRATSRRKPFWSASVVQRRCRDSRRRSRVKLRGGKTLTRLKSHHLPWQSGGTCCPPRCRESGAAVNNQWFSKVAVWLVIALVLFTVFKQFDRGRRRPDQIGYSDFPGRGAAAKRIKSVVLQEGGGGDRDRAHHHRRQAHPHHRHLPGPRSGRRPDQQRRQVRRQTRARSPRSC